MRFSFKQKRHDPIEQSSHEYLDQEEYLGKSIKPITINNLYYLIKDTTDHLLELRAELNGVTDIRKYQIDIVTKRQEREQKQREIEAGTI